MIILTAGHTGPNTGAQCATTQFDEGAENIWLRDRIAEILTNKYGLVVLVDDNRASLQLLIKELNESTGDGRQSTDNRPDIPEETDRVAIPGFFRSGDRLDSCYSGNSDYRLFLAGDRQDTDYAVAAPAILSPTDVTDLTPSAALVPLRQGDNMKCPTEDFVIDIHFNAHTNPQARGTEAIVADDATTLELRFASRLAHATADALGIPLRCIKTENETPHRCLGMLHITPQSLILEVCFCTSPEDVEAYRRNRDRLAEELARNIAELVSF